MMNLDIELVPILCNFTQSGNFVSQLLCVTTAAQYVCTPGNKTVMNTVQCCCDFVSQLLCVTTAAQYVCTPGNKAVMNTVQCCCDFVSQLLCVTTAAQYVCTPGNKTVMNTVQCCCNFCIYRCRDLPTYCERFCVQCTL